jgi:hypothetical protein
MTKERSVLQMVDFREQPHTSHLVFPPSGDHAPVAIDTWDVEDWEFRGFVNGSDRPVIVMPADSHWVVYSRSLVTVLGTEEALREGIGRKLAMRDVEREMLKNEPVPPDAPRIFVVPGDMADDVSAEKKPLPGQYL